MPELPEVQTIVNDLNKKIAGRRIVKIWFDWPKMLHTKNAPTPSGFGNTKASIRIFTRIIRGKKILSVRRRAKNLLFDLSGGLMMLIHLKMTGHLLVGKWNVEVRHGKKIAIPIEPKEVVRDPYNQYIHVIFYLDPVRSRSPRGGRNHSLKARAASNGVDNGKMLGFSDLRKFGKILLGTKEQIENLPELKNLGPEPLDKSFTLDKFKEALRHAQGRKIKQVLMDPEVIAGIGNIYSDDILWSAKINPLRPANKLSNQELRILYKAIKMVLVKGLKLRGTSISDYRDTAGKEGFYSDHRLVYQREGEPCPRCKTKIKRVKVGGRSAHFCPRCQS